MGMDCRKRLFSIVRSRFMIAKMPFSLTLSVTYVYARDYANQTQ